MTTITRETLTKYGHDSEVEVTSFDGRDLTMRIEVDSHDGELCLLKFRDVMHIDLDPRFDLDHVDFGGPELLPEGYLARLDLESSADRDFIRVARFTDQDDLLHYVLSYQREGEITDV